MNLVIRVILAILAGAVVGAIAEAICRHFAIDTFWGWLVGVLVALVVFVNYRHDNPGL